MIANLAQRLAMLVVVVLLVSLMTMLVLDLAPGDPARDGLGPEATPAQIADYRHELGLDRSFPVRYYEFVKSFVTFDFGRSMVTKQKISDSMQQTLPVTLEIALLAFFFSFVISIPIGLYAGYKNGGWLDRAVLTTASALQSVPSFLIAIVLVYILSVRNRIFPTQGWVKLADDPWENFRHAFLPAFALALPIAFGWTRILRNDVVATLQEDYVTAAHAQGLTTRKVLFKYVLRPSMFTLVTVMGIGIGLLIGGTVLIEQIFGLPGLGSLAFQSVTTKDYTTLRALVLLFAITYVLVSVAIDLIYPILDPRVRE
jgi:peptide/nickel transport system permease protein